MKVGPRWESDIAKSNILKLYGTTVVVEQESIFSHLSWTSSPERVLIAVNTAVSVPCVSLI